MNKYIFSFLLFLCTVSIHLYGQTSHPGHANRQILVEWKDGTPSGTIEVLNGVLTDIEITKGKGKAKGNTFEFRTSANNRMKLSFDSIKTNPGSGATVVTINTHETPFSFFLRDVNTRYPIYIPEYKVVVLPMGFTKSYDEVEAMIQSRQLLTKYEQIEKEPEESYDSVKEKTRNQSVPTWLGISRDIRIFQISPSLEDMPGETDVISPKNAAGSLTLPATNNREINYLYTAGRGQGVETNVSRRLENGVLPILHSRQTDDDMDYHTILFTSLESMPLAENTPIGTDFLVADHYSSGHMFTDEQKKKVEEKLEEFKKEQSEQTVLYGRVEAKNTGMVPRYAWFKIPRPGRGWWDRIAYSYDKITGFSSYSENQVFCVSKLNGNPVMQEETALLVEPGETVTLEFYLPHSPLSQERAKRLFSQSFETRYAEVKKFWQNKLNRATALSLPEKRIDEMVQAGLLHLDLITYGKDPDNTLAPMIGIYSPIGTESSPIIQFYCSMGWFDNARRTLMYFLDKQHKNGLIQNFGGYMVETGAALWSMGEYYRYTVDNDWVTQVAPKLKKSCEYLLNWREKNRKDHLKDRGYGMIDGKVADPEDPFYQFMLNSYGYLGVSRVAEMLKQTDPGYAEQLNREAEFWKQDILSSFNHSMARSPVVPLGDGTWCPTVAPWAGAVGPRALYVNEETFFSHGTFTVPDVMLGPLYLVFCEVVDPHSQASKMMLNYHSELFFQNNAVFSQPYYSRHNWIQLKLGMVKPFLKTYYNTFSALADRETYTFWEHLYHASPHKTHEEGWFLMETRWMLYMEEQQTLKLLPGIPRKWLEHEKTISIDNASSYFGSFSLQVNSHINEGYMTAKMSCKTDRKPEIVTIRLPHPEGKTPRKITGGLYDA
ncbi:MAG: hypothetical protein PHS40_05280, partial [Mariniphaga sp.]|nr:hypothetical protein [Mariniphaga sp.]